MIIIMMHILTVVIKNNLFYLLVHVFHVTIYYFYFKQHSYTILMLKVNYYFHFNQQSYTILMLKVNARFFSRESLRIRRSCNNGFVQFYRKYYSFLFSICYQIHRQIISVFLIIHKSISNN